MGFGQPACVWSVYFGTWGGGGVGQPFRAVRTHGRNGAREIVPGRACVRTARNGQRA